MFRNNIEQTPFTSEAANAYFENISGCAIFEDMTFVSTLRALLGRRIPKEDKVKLCTDDSTYGNEVIGEYSPKRIIQAMCDYSYIMDGRSYGVLQIHNIHNTSSEANQKIFDILKEHFCEVYESWFRVPKVTEFFQKTFNVLCFINTERKSVYLFAENLDLRRMHYLQCGIVAYFPWYFNKEDGVTESEMELIKSLKEKTPEKYLLCLNKEAERYDFRSEKIRKYLAGFETIFEKQELENCKNSFSEIMEEINSLNSRLCDAIEQKRRIDSRILGLEMSISRGEGESEIMEYFLCNKRLVLEKCDRATLVFGVKDYLTYFDNDMAEAMINNPDSYVYHPNRHTYESVICHDDMKMLMEAIFIDQTLKIKMCAAYRFRIGGSISALGNHRYGYDYDGCTPNTHIDRYECLGNHSRVINELLVNNNYIGAIEQCISSCKSLNFADSPVMNEFMERFYGRHNNINIRCIELPNGEIATPTEAIVYLKENQAEDQTGDRADSQEETENNG